MDEKTKKTMEEKDIKIINLMRLARKAGKISIGSEAVMSSFKRGKVALLFVATNAEKNSLKVADRISGSGVPTQKIMTKILLGDVFSRNSVGVVSINDNNFAKGFCKLML